MGIADLRAAFNEEAAGVFTCDRCYMRYERKDETDFQRLEFHGIRADGTQFDVRSDLIRPGADLTEAARVVARGLVAKHSGDPTP